MWVHRTCFLNNLLRDSKKSTHVSSVSKIWSLQDPAFRMRKRCPLVKVLDLFTRVPCLISFIIYLAVVWVDLQPMECVNWNHRQSRPRKQKEACTAWYGFDNFVGSKVQCREVHTIDHHRSQRVRKNFTSTPCKLFEKHLFPWLIVKIKILGNKNVLKALFILKTGRE